MDREKLITQINSALEKEFDKHKVNQRIEVDGENITIRVPKTLEIRDTKELLRKSPKHGEGQLFDTISKGVALPFLKYLDDNTVRVGGGDNRWITVGYLRSAGSKEFPLEFERIKFIPVSKKDEDWKKNSIYVNEERSLEFEGILVAKVILSTDAPGEEDHEKGQEGNLWFVVSEDEV